MGGEGAAANFARRSPVPMINLLRTPQATPPPPSFTQHL